MKLRAVLCIIIQQPIEELFSLFVNKKAAGLIGNVLTHLSRNKIITQHKQRNAYEKPAADCAEKQSFDFPVSEASRVIQNV